MGRTLGDLRLTFTAGSKSFGRCRQKSRFPNANIGYGSIDLRLDTSTNGLKQVYTSPKANY
jgi:hypothetical protein